MSVKIKYIFVLLSFSLLLLATSHKSYGLTSEVLLLSGTVGPEISVNPVIMLGGREQRLAFNLETNLLIGFKVFLNGAPLIIQNDTFTLAYLNKIVSKKMDQKIKEQLVTVVVN